MTEEEKENLFYKDGNIIRINKSELDKPIFRVFSKRWLIDALTKKKNNLIKPAMWDDPFENFIFQLKAKMKDGTQVGFDTLREIIMDSVGHLVKRKLMPFGEYIHRAKMALGLRQQFVKYLMRFITQNINTQ
jgi:hypothetical protein